MNKLARIICLWCLLFLVPASYGGPLKTVTFIDQNVTVVTGTRYRESLSSIPAHISVITTRQEHDHKAHNIPELLQKESDLHIADMTGSKRFYNVDLRGFGETAPLNTLVLVDGRRVTQPNISGTDWLQIPVDRVARIEIMRGGQGSVLYGDNAAAGVVNIVTETTTAPETKFRVGVGSYDTARISISRGIQGDNTSGTVSAVYTDTDGYRDNSAMRARDYGLNLICGVNDANVVHFNAGYHGDRTGIPGTLKQSYLDSGGSRTASMTPDDFNEVDDFYVQVTPEFSLGKNGFLTVDTSYRKRQSNSHFTVAGGSFEDDTEIVTRNIAPRLVLRRHFGSVFNTVTVGYDRENIVEDIANDSTFAGLNTYRFKKETSAFYLTDRVELSKTWHLTAGYRHNRTRYRFNPGSLSEDNDLYALGATYRANKRTRFFVSYAKSFRFPALDEYYSFFFDSLDLSLVPQVSDDYELGLRHRFDDTFSAGLTVFRIDTSDEIFSDPAVFVSKNLDGTTRRGGIELNAAKTFPGYTLKVHYTFLEATVQDGSHAGNVIPNVPRHRLSAGISWSAGNDYTMRLSGQHIGGRPFINDFDNNFTDQKAYTVMSLHVRRELNNGSVFITVNNAGNAGYSGYALIDGGEKAYSTSPKINVTVGFDRTF